MNKQIKIFFIVIVVIFFVLTTYFLLFARSKNKGDNALLKVKTLSSSEGIPEEGSTKYFIEGWSNVPYLIKLEKETSSLGGAIVKVSYTTAEEYLWAKTGYYVEDDNSPSESNYFEGFFKLRTGGNNWQLVEPANIPKEIIDALK